VAGRSVSMKNFNDATGNRKLNLPGYRAVYGEYVRGKNPVI
jgi:hypothetical protein